MISINILPKKDFTRLKQERLSSWLLLCAISLLLFLALEAGAVFYFVGISQNKTNDLEQQISQARTEIEQQKNVELEANITKLNNLGKRLDAIYQKQLLWHKTLADLAESTPVGITWKSLNINAFSGKTDLMGHADNRDQLIKFSQQIEDNDSFSDFVSPLSNLTSKENIDFTFTFKIKVSP
ncbi:MAG: hypothetical protein ACD_68C00133G0005 [uncultured bacterium]|nr:MAG: hypothetical protein ACD_68C00133G0005 [uncultured bacterium]